MMDRGPHRQRGELEGFSRRGCGFCKNTSLTIDYKDPQTLRYFLTDRGKIVPRRVSGTCAKHQRAITRAINRARTVALLPFTTNE